MNITLIAAVGKKNEIGGNNDLLWDLPDDMKFFKETTAGFPVIMGRKNYFSLPEKFRPLPNRENLVLTSDKNLTLDNEVHIFHSVSDVMHYCRQQEFDNVFVIGGGQIYAQFLANADRLLITEINGRFKDADTFFPEINPEKWKEVSRLHHPKDERHGYAFDFVEYTKA